MAEFRVGLDRLSLVSTLLYGLFQRALIGRTRNESQTDTDHALNMEKPEEFNRAVSGFLGGAEGQKRSR